MSGRPELKTDPRTRDNQARVANRAFVVGTLEEWLAPRRRDEGMRELEAHDVPSAPVNAVSEVFADPQVQARGLVQSYQHPVIGEVRYTTTPLLREPDPRPHAYAPLLGEHTEQVLRDELGLSEEELAAAISSGAAAGATAGPVHDGGTATFRA